MLWGKKNRKFGDPRAFFGLKEDLPVATGQSGFRPKDIIGPRDDRLPVGDALSAPFKYLGLIYGKNREQDRASKFGTGCLVGPNAFVTAAHVVHDQTKYWYDGFPKITKIWLALNGDINNPPFPARTALKVFVHERYLADPLNIDYDVAVVRFDRNVDGRHGWLGFGGNWNESDDLLVAGYPSDLQDTPSRMFRASGKLKRLDGLRLYHGVDSWAGQSGAPVIVRQGTAHRAIAVHTRGTDEAQRLNLEANMAVQLEGEILEWVMAHSEMQI